MKLTTLNPVWIKVTLVLGRPTFAVVETRTEANGLRFDCPRCLTEDPEHQHTVTVLNGTVLAGIPPGPGRWDAVGPTFDSLTLKGVAGRSDSVWFQGGCGAHFYLRNGEITFA